MLTKKVEKAMNDQLAMELESAYVYLSMSAFCESESFPGLASWLREQAKEEVDHAMRFYTFISDRGARVTFGALPQPPHDWKSPLAVFESALEHEQAVTRSISDLYGLVVAEKDYAAQAWLDWFATEQVEEEKMVGQIVDSLRRVGDQGEGMYLVDKELGTRTGAL